MECIVCLSYGASPPTLLEQSCIQSSFFGSTSVLKGGATIAPVAVAGRSSSHGAVIVVGGKGKRNYMQGRMPQTRQRPTLPKLDDDDNPKFLLFVRSKNVPVWYPLSIVTGGATAKIMVAAMKNEWGKKLYQGTLTRNIASVAYKDEKAMRASAVKAYSVLKQASELDYGYKLVDKSNPDAALFTSDVIKIPPKEELKSVVDKVKDFLGNNFNTMKESFGSISNLSLDKSEETTPPLQEESQAKSK